MDLEAIVRTFIFTLRRLEAIKSFKQSSETSYDMILKDRSKIAFSYFSFRKYPKAT